QRGAAYTPWGEEVPMTKIYLRLERVAWLTQHGYWLSLGGAVLLALALGPFHDLGFVSGLMLLLFGGCCGAFRHWHRERGLWMLALVALCAWISLYVTFQWDAVRRELNNPNPRPWLLSLEMVFAASVAWLQVRFLLTVMWLNRALFAQAQPVAGLSAEPGSAPDRGGM